MALTRILNNQVTDASGANVYLGINAAAKLQAYSITSTRIANNLTYGSNLTITGNLDVQGATTTIDTYNVVIEDPLLLLAKDQSGAPSADIGFIGERGSETNIAFVWDESADEFVTAFTSTAVSNTTISISSYANFKTFDAAVTGNLAVTGTSDFTGDATFTNIGATGYINADGNVSGGNIISNALITGTTLEISQNARIQGNLTIEGNLTYVNVDDLRVEDPIIILGTGPNGAPLSADDGMDRGVYMEYYTTGLGNAYIGWQNSSGNMIIANDVSFSGNNVVSVGSYGTLEAGNAYVETVVASGIINSGSEVLGATLHSEGVANVIGTLQVGSNTTTTGAAIAVNTTDSILIPVGNSLQRPNSPVTGMIRFNTTTDQLEFYDADSWTPAGSIFTIVVSDQFTGDDSTTNFTLSQDSTTAGTMVAINGIVQIPTVAYSVSGNVLQFTEAPAPSDVIDARILTTTATVTAIQNATGTAVLEAASSGINFNITGNLIPTANVTYNLGTDTARFNEIFLAGSTITLGDAVIKASGGTVQFYGADGTTPAPASFASITKTGTDGVGNIGQADNTFNTVFAKATSAQYADLAENYEADAEYAPGTVVCFGGAKEVTVCDHDEDTRVAGVVSTNPSYLMNSACPGEYVAAVALTGRVPCKVVGPVKKGDLMVSAGNGSAKAKNDAKIGSVIGKALQDFDGVEGTIEVVVGRF